MSMSEPVLLKRIPTSPWGNINERRVVHYDEYVATGGYESLRKAMAMDRSDVVDLVKACVLRGRGGAGFPAGLKWSFLPAPDGEQRYLCVNCDEAEPGTFKDRLLVDYDPHLVLEGIAIACYACQLDVAYFFIRGEYHHQALVTENAIREAYEHGIFGSTNGKGMLGSDQVVECHLHRSAGAYICGEETGLLEAIEGKRGWPRIKPPFPAVKGLFGRPTVVNNVETLACVVPIVEFGEAWWKSHGCESSLEKAPPSYGPKLMGVSGHVNRPGCYECDLGIPLRELIESDKYCGGMRGGKRFKGAIAGGVSMGILGPDQFDAEMDFDIGTKFDVLGLGTACPTVFDEDTDMVAVRPQHRAFFRQRIVRSMHAVSRGRGLDAEVTHSN